MTSIGPALRQVKDDAAALLRAEPIQLACVAAGHVWRVRELDPVMTISVMMMQVLHATSCRGVLRAARLNVSPTAYCKAKRRLPIDVVHLLLLELAQCVPSMCHDANDAGRWRGHRTVMVDGSSSSMPDAPALQEAFKQPASMKEGCGFPVMHLQALFDQATGMILDLLTHRHDTHDMAHVAKLHPMLEEGDVHVGNRGFCSYAHLALLSQDNLNGVFRVHQRRIVSFKPGRRTRCQQPKHKRTGHPTSRFIARLGKHDQVVEYIKPATPPRWINAQTYAALPESIHVREVRYRVKRGRGCSHEITLATTLLDAKKYPSAS